MKTLYKVLESLLSSDFEDQLDSKLLGELDNFIGVLKSTKLNRRAEDVYFSDDQKLCDAAERVANTSAFKSITRAKANKLLQSKTPSTILVVNWSGMGTHEWKLVDTAAWKYIRIGCVLGWEHWSGPSTNIQINDVRSGKEDQALGHNRNHKLYIFPAGTYEYFKDAIN